MIYPSIVISVSSCVQSRDSSSSPFPQIQTFVDEHFHKPGDEFEDWDPSDWSEE
ncbi:hypothetical protein E2C01_086776 [Portunus trituberculatus]|uniref:Uncharacterized protein n=1 Tax=Portunus trituberculatus TaxID=210409 RepID=A0A5B7J4Q9_PORTR|nr:hypothetical protein [Portunus trituberculatus]